ncbi:RIP metalloprotease RseP [Massilia sp. PWRC2]|uniref:RIP metalloprotease RseP n=1 Tax=Massilia sp. PWRC2 TaxID=2804626 RepID=UPI003CF2D46E
MNNLLMIPAFLLALGPLVIFHELGHYLVARLCGVKVLRFSVGMGKVVWSRKFGADQTEWAVSALPLGGYVKMLDAREQDGVIDSADAHREFTSQSVWRRMAIVVAGPLANFLLAIVLLAGLAMAGTTEPSARLRAPDPGSAAWQAGLRGSDLITAVDGKLVASWAEMRWALVDAIVEKRAARLDARQPQGGQLAAIVPAAALATLDIDSDFTRALGLDLWRPAAAVETVVAASPAALAGVRAGDIVSAVDGKTIVDGVDLVKAVRASNGKALAITLQRGPQTLTVSVTPQLRATDKVWAIGMAPAVAPELVTVTAGPLDALAIGARRTWDTVTITLKMIKRMVQGEVSLKNITGPLTIADYAQQTMRLGPAVFIGFIAFVSISLGVMNLLPIPVLDGGLLLYYSLEVLTGRPLSERIGAYAQRAGVVLLAMLMALALFNDIARRL